MSYVCCRRRRQQLHLCKKRSRCWMGTFWSTLSLWASQSHWLTSLPLATYILASPRRVVQTWLFGPASTSLLHSTPILAVVAPFNPTQFVCTRHIYCANQALHCQETVKLVKEMQVESGFPQTACRDARWLLIAGV